MDGLTNVCEATSQSLDFDGFRPTHRKGKKLLAEKKRRARINNCLMRIRDIVYHGEEEKETDLDKMEKAEILEKTLEVLTRVRHNFDNSRKMSSQSTQKAMAVRYASGFSSCAEESIRYIQNSRLIPTEVKHQLQSHLRSIAHRMESKIQEEESGSYSQPYTSPSVVIAPPQIVSLSSPTMQPSASSLSFMVDNGDGTARLQITPTKNIDFHISNVRKCYQPTEVVSSSSQINFNKPALIPSPIRTSTPVSLIDNNNKLSSSVLNSAHNKDNSITFIPIGITELSHCQDHKENQPNKYHSNIPVPCESSQYRNDQTDSTFFKFTPPHCKSASPKSDQSHQMTQNASTSSTSPSLFSSSQYSPISPVPSPVIIHTSSVQSTIRSSAPESIYKYHGYEPYPTNSHTTFSNTLSLPVPGHSPSEIQQLHTPVKAMDLCVKRNDSHISPETMWRPW